jgi:murein L,D-transpeptidase YcbB/YkuD
MRHHTVYFRNSVVISSLLSGVIILFFAIACGNNKSPQPGSENITVKTDAEVRDLIAQSLNNALNKESKINDSAELSRISNLMFLYEQKKFEPLWSAEKKWLSPGDLLYDFIKNARSWGLFPENYHFKQLDSIRYLFFADSLGRTYRSDANLWVSADIMLTDAFIQLLHDIKLGRLQNDSVMYRADSIVSKELILEKLNALNKPHIPATVFATIEPSHRGYRELKAGIQKFLDSADFREYTYLPFPYSDTLKFKKLLQQRLFESGFISFNSPRADMGQLNEAVKKFQLSKKLAADGKAGGATVRLLNNNDNEKFYRIAITLDRYKMMPEKMPEKYIWINLPAYRLQLWTDDSVKLSSRIVVGKPLTRTPVLTSAVSEMITYPKWTIPNSIIVKEILPALKRNTGYLARKGYSLFNRKGELTSPDSVDWSKFSKGIPYNVVQGSGDENALGVLKFNFINKYQVYLHDTNQRYLFGQESRALSHGCVRVQEWSRLAYFIIENDRLNGGNNGSVRTSRDSLSTWLQRKEKHTIALSNKIPVYIRYFSCEGKNGSIVFYDDIYGEDALLRDKYYAHK